MYRRVGFDCPFVLLAPLLLGLAGCAHQQTRLQSEDESERDRYQVAVIGDKTQVGNAAPVPVSGVGLVEGLEGTGGDVPADGLRAMLENELHRDVKERHVRELLTSPNNALVLVSALLPPGARAKDVIDVEVTLPRNSKATSLRGGRLRKCYLYNYDFTKHLNPNYKGGDALLIGHPIVEAQGAVLVGLGDGTDEALRRGHIWLGGRSRIDEPLTLVMNPDQQYARLTALITDRINDTFQAGVAATRETAIAYTADNMVVYLRVPPQYKLNLPRYLRVVRLLPLQEGLDGPGLNEPGRHSYRQRLLDDLLDPTRTVTAALRLEALGPHSIPALKKGLDSKHPLVRFCAAEALAYLGSPSGSEELARAVTEQPLLRAFGLTAMASLDEAVCQVKLGELVALGADDETRYGAFRALLTLDENNRAMRGELLNDSYWLHRAAPTTAPLVHVSTVKRAEVVLFGEEPFLKAPFWFMAGEFAITATDGDTHCTVSRFPLRGTPVRRQCSLRLEDVLRTMADLGGAFPDTVALLQQADRCECLSCRVSYNAMPQASTVYELVQAGQETGSSAELVPGDQDLGLTPTLYDTGSPQEQERRLQAQSGTDPSSQRAARKPASDGE
jgi:hypothetical protein